MLDFCYNTLLFENPSSCMVLKNCKLNVMTALFIILGVLCLLIGIVGCAVPVIPGPALAFCSLFALLPIGKSPSGLAWGISAAILVSAFIVDYTVPALGAKKFKASRYGIVGCFIGTIIGAFFFPFGILLGPFLGAVAGELLSGRKMNEALNGGTGALIGFLAGTMYKMFVCGIFAFIFVKYAAV